MKQVDINVLHTFLDNEVRMLQNAVKHHSEFIRTNVPIIRKHDHVFQKMLKSKLKNTIAARNMLAKLIKDRQQAEVETKS